MKKSNTSEVIRGKGVRKASDNEWGESLIALTAKGPGTYAGELLAVEHVTGGRFGDQWRIRMQCDDGQGRILYTGAQQVAESIAPFVGSRVKLVRNGTKLDTRWSAVAAKGAKRTDYVIRDVAARASKAGKGAAKRKAGRGK